MLKTVFTINLNDKLLPRRVAVGKFDGVHSCIVAATSGDKVLVHNPHSRSLNTDGRSTIGGSVSDTNYLNINQTIQTLATGKLRPGHDNDVLVVGTPTSLLVYDVENNVDLFYREIPDGANVVLVDTIGEIERPLAIAGGNCALQGFDYQGNDAYWTVTGDNITTMAVCDINEDGLNELIVGSEDFDIRVFKEDTILYELNETDAVTCLCSVMPDYFGYALANGTVGVYRKRERLWRIKSKNQAICIFSFDINSDGVPELVTGWSSGKVDGRSIETGEVVFKDNMNHSIAAIMTADYNMDGIDELMVCSVNGEIRGYVAASIQERLTVSDAAFEQETVRDLLKKKQILMLELRNYEENTRVAEAGGLRNKGKASTEEDNFGAIPANTQLKSSLVINTEDKEASVQLSLQTTNDTVMRAVVIFAEGIFNGESHVVHPNESEINTVMNIALRPPKDIPIDLHIKAMVGYKGSYHYHVFELTRHLPRFSMYALSKVSNIHEQNKPRGNVLFNIGDKTNRVIQWINKNFLLIEELDYEDSLSIAFVSLRDLKPLIFEMSGRSGEINIRTDNIELAGEIIQSLCVELLNLEDLQSTANFPIEIENLKKLITKVEDIQSVRLQLAAEIADNSGLVRALVVRAEDARLLGEFKLMKQIYTELNQLNTELINEYKIRSQNHQDLVENLKQINILIQKSGNLRVGPSKTRLIQACRIAIKQNNLNTLTRIITTGET